MVGHPLPGGYDAIHVGAAAAKVGHGCCMAINVVINKWYPQVLSI